MIRKILILTVFISAFVISTAFAAFNMQSVSLDVFFAQWQLPLAVLLIAVLLVGLLIGATLIALSTLRIRYENHRLVSKLQNAEQELNSLRILPVRDSH
ncbi:lipopolysaccharide assembly protein LapA domain-containing protein [Methylophaga pinxianii]|uniref:lipopolysaccharide assembly protein LapA domain-containing protein n=1 Tax=Methylophaga pinxianii TaxID=2881052 RepID=UPI001CF51220|nr:lipopolysaccharide assembly protein LapA domain-containing protein [Methylophaga pinxianii]MCB2428314.1 lipopolysaccharide assembly protein LapA domain-containing protein [Methylophaga pinxianii]UPH45251.1 lipopolysaccharide assembly protein LapA domain-containing protein [Methylophaga pinxianii]